VSELLAEPVIELLLGPMTVTLMSELLSELLSEPVMEMQSLLQSLESDCTQGHRCPVGMGGGGGAADHGAAPIRFHASIVDRVRAH
jgi:hypothetical protein